MSDMNRERWRRIDTILASALELPSEARAAFLDRACGGDQDLRREVETLIAHDRGEGLLPTKPLAAFVAAERLIVNQRMGDEGGARSPLSSDSIEEARFVPGALLAGRYRVVGLLGRGGMGEVYRADDLKLRQAVALKLLPERLSADGAALARFYQEVSVARQVSHRNVCRVYDVGEAEGLHFLSMEYVRGEELASVIKRFGRLPPDKAVEVARQLCGGLAAIHEKGVIHRDLKPSNVMIDERGDVRITDFGIAVVAEEVGEREALAGTPAYMSPEQLAGAPLTVRSDIYSLGLVLYELFTGRRAFDARTVEDLLRLRQSDATPSAPSSLVRDLDPVVERVIERCLERDAERRPASALQVAAALPGGDPLAEALAAGETPSPEMVAAAPKEGALRPAVAVALLAVFLAALPLVMLLADRVELYSHVPLDKPPDVLRERAREVVKRLGYAAPGADDTSGFDDDFDALSYIEEHDPSPARWEKLKTGRPAAVYFWHRQSPSYLEPLGPQVWWEDPPPVMAGMSGVRLDTEGRLLHFYGVPPQVGGAGGAGAPAPDWSALFGEAGLDVSAFAPAESKWAPLYAHDARAAWEGAYAERPEIPVRVEAASYRGRPVYFEVVNPWDKPAREQPSELPAHFKSLFYLLGSVFLLVLAGSVLLAVRNLRLGRGDRRGATRLALFVFAAEFVFWASVTHHVPTGAEFISFLSGLKESLFGACFLWIVYVALEPFVRRRWPHRIISWSRLLAGDLKDPLVGRDILIGAVFGVMLNLITLSFNFGQRWIDGLPRRPFVEPSSTHLGLGYFVPAFISQFVGPLSIALVFLFVVFFLSVLLRGDARGAVAGWLIFTVALAFLGGNTPADWARAAVASAVVAFTLHRYGLFALWVGFVYLHVIIQFPVTTRLNAWYARGFIIDLIILIALAAYGFRKSLAGRPLFRPGLLQD